MTSGTSNPLDLALPYQIQGAEYLSNTGLLCDDMGLGKGLTSLLWHRRVGGKRTLVTGPKEITSNLKREIPRWVDTPLFDLRLWRTTRERDHAFSLIRGMDEFIVLLNLESWRKDFTNTQRVVSLQCDTVIIDEAHHLNNGRTINYKGVREIVYASNQCPNCSTLLEPIYTCRRRNCSRQGTRFSNRHCFTCGQVATLVRIPRCIVCGIDPVRDGRDLRSVRNVLGITGTPILNHPKELFWLLSLLSLPFITTERKFLDTFCEPAKEGGNRYVWKPKGKERLANLIAPHFIARKRTEVGIKLPPRSIEIREFEFDKTKYADQWKAYKRLEENFKLDLSTGTLGISEVITQLLRLRQMLVWPNGIIFRDPDTKTVIDRVSIGSSFKLDIVERLATEFLETERILVFSQFKEPLRELQRRLGTRAVVYDGDTPSDVRDAIREDFRVSAFHPRWNAALCNYASAGEGINLPGATQTIILDEHWNPGKNRQAYDRTYRLDQVNATGVHIIRITGTVDDWLAELNEFKAGIVDGFSDAIDLQEKLRQAMEVHA